LDACAEWAKGGSQDAATAQARDKLGREAQSSGDIPSTAPGRYCYAVCADQSGKCFNIKDDSACVGYCSPALTDPPELTPGGFRLDLDQTSSTASVIFIPTSDIGHTNAAGLVGVDFSNDCIGPLGPTTIKSCGFTLSWLTLKGIKDFSVGGHSFSQIQVSLPAPLKGNILTADTTSLFTVPPGTMMYMSAIFDGKLIGAEFALNAPIIGAIDWTTREFASLGSLATSDGNGLLLLGITSHVTNLPPTANAGAPQTVECGSNRSGQAVLSGALSTDPDGFADIVRFDWSSGSPGASILGSGASFTKRVPLGTTNFTLTVADRAGSMSTTSTSVKVVDNTPPVFQSATSVTDCLWPPDHALRLFRLGNEIKAAATDTCDGGSSTIRIVNVVSDQPVLGGGSGATTPDVRFGPNAFCIRSERAGTIAKPRTYTVTLESVDKSGNRSRKDVAIQVDHDSRGGGACTTSSLVTSVTDNDPRCEE
jgi:hypothetical protein